MLQWIKNIPIPLIYLSFLLLWFYYAIFSASYLALLGFVFLLVCLFFQFPWKSASKVLVICGIFGFWFVFQNWQQSQASQNLADSVEGVRILPDTIKLMVIVYPFVASLTVVLSKSIINSSPRRRKKPFKL
ncbi:competence protein CelB [Streptococcus pneumoniae]|nr:competence protein CelB [Streptococcus pneumoniae]